MTRVALAVMLTAWLPVACADGADGLDAHMHRGRSVQAWFEDLAAESEDRRLAATESVRELVASVSAGQPLAVSMVDVLLHGPTVQRRLVACALQATAELTPSWAMEPLCRAVQDDDRRVRECAVAALADARHVLPDPRALGVALVDSSSTIRGLACRALRNSRTAAAHELVRARFLDDDPTVRETAADVVTSIDADGGDETLKDLAAMLADPSPAVRTAASVSLARYGPRSVGRLGAALQTPSTRLEAARGLGLVGAPARELAPDLLRMAVSNNDALVRLAAAESYWLITKDATGALAALRPFLTGETTDGTIQGALLILGRLGPEALPLAEALGDVAVGTRAPAVRQGAIATIVRTGPSGVEAQSGRLVRLVESEDQLEGVRRSALVALSHARRLDAGTLGVLERVRRTAGAPWVREHAAWILESAREGTLGRSPFPY